ncbi:MAG: hypothetical protein ACFFDN_43980 [Candidatus Hodarchaeota archaeon]
MSKVVLGQGEKIERKGTMKGHWKIKEAQKIGNLARKLVDDEKFRKEFQENTHEVLHEMGIKDLPVEFIPQKFMVPIGFLKTVLNPKRRSPGHSDYSDYVDYCQHYTYHYDHNVHSDSW